MVAVRAVVDPAAVAAVQVAAVVDLAITLCTTTGTTVMMNTVAKVEAKERAAWLRAVRLEVSAALVLVLVRVRHRADRAATRRKGEVYTALLT